MPAHSVHNRCEPRRHIRKRCDLGLLSPSLSCREPATGQPRNDGILSLHLPWNIGSDSFGKAWSHGRALGIWSSVHARLRVASSTMVKVTITLQRKRQPGMCWRTRLPSQTGQPTRICPRLPRGSLSVKTAASQLCRTDGLRSSKTREKGCHRMDITCNVARSGPWDETYD